MALQFPLSLSEFFGGLGVIRFSLDLGDGLVVTRTRGGEVLTAETANRLWQGEVSLRDVRISRQDAVRAKISALRQAGASFFVAPSHRCGPILDPSGAGLDGYSPQIAVINANNREMRIKGMPDGYQLSPGDYLSFTYGSPEHHSFHQVVTGAVGTAGSSGWVEVIPHIPRGAAPDDPVRLVRPQFKAILDDRPSYGAMSSGGWRGVGFQFIQTLR